MHQSDDIGLFELISITDKNGEPYPSTDWRNGYIGEVGVFKLTKTSHGNQFITFRILEPQRVMTDEGKEVVSAQYQYFSTSKILRFDVSEEDIVTAETSNSIYRFRPMTVIEDLDTTDLKRAIEKLKT